LDENFSRLITTFDEVPLPSCARTRARPKTAPARRFTTRVLTWNVDRRSLVRPRLRSKTLLAKRKSSVEERSPQGLRRPRFSFFRFTCQTARDRGGPALRWTGGPSKLMASDGDRKPDHRLPV